MISHLPQLLMAACLLFILTTALRSRSRYDAPAALIGCAIPVLLLWFGGFWTP